MFRPLLALWLLPREPLVTPRGARVADKAAQAIGYIRVSTEEQANQGVSLEAQRGKIAAYCGLHGPCLAHTYADEGLSGKRADNRPGLQRAITHACESKGVLVVYSLSRLARSTRDAIEIAERLARAEADLVSITEKIDTTTSMGRFFFTTVAALAQLERDQISERTCMAMAHKRSKCQRISGIIPYGYQLAEDGATLTEAPAERRVVEMIGKLRCEGLSTRAIARQLDLLGLKPREGWHWHPKVIMDLARRAGPTQTQNKVSHSIT
jgi:site-specific DNA recombinase